MAKKKNPRRKIQEDTDGTYYCSDCGQAGFKTQQSCSAHMKSCKGFEAISESVNNQYSQFTESLGRMIGNSYPEKNWTPAGKATPPPAGAWSSSAPDSHAGARILRAGVRAEGFAENAGSTQKERLLIAKLEESLKVNERLHKYAFNHVQHITPRQKISNPNDLLMSGLNDLAQNKWFQRIIAFGALVWAISWIKENLEKLERKSSNSGKKSKKD